MNDLKGLFFVALAVGSTVAFLFARNRSWEERFLKRGVVTAILVKFVCCVIIYVFWPSLIQYSDARQFYLPQTIELLSGKIPNKDFMSSYSILFLPIFALPVKLWPSAGSIVLTMLAVETAMLSLYLKRCLLHSWSGGWQVAFLYSWSPFSIYWVAMSGHNSILIAFWIMLGLILAENGRAVLSGVAAAMALLTSKILALLAWPALVFYSREGWIRRIAPMALSFVLIGVLMLFGIDSISPIRHELAFYTTGNLWSISGKLFQGVAPNNVWPFLPMIAFTLLYAPMCIAFLKRNTKNYRFDKVVAFVAATNLLFLVMSKKAFSYYLIMSLIFVFHTVIVHKHRLVFNLLLLAFLGAISRLEQIHGWDNKWIIIETLRIVSYTYLLIVCFGSSIRRAWQTQPSG